MDCGFFLVPKPELGNEGNARSYSDANRRQESARRSVIGCRDTPPLRPYAPATRKSGNAALTLIAGKPAPTGDEWTAGSYRG